MDMAAGHLNAWLIYNQCLHDILWRHKDLRWLGHTRHHWGCDSPARPSGSSLLLLADGTADTWPFVEICEAEKSETPPNRRYTSLELLCCERLRSKLRSNDVLGIVHIHLYASSLLPYLSFHRPCNWRRCLDSTLLLWRSTAHSADLTLSLAQPFNILNGIYDMLWNPYLQAHAWEQRDHVLDHVRRLPYTYPYGCKWACSLLFIPSKKRDKHVLSTYCSRKFARCLSFKALPRPVHFNPKSPQRIAVASHSVITTFPV